MSSTLAEERPETITSTKLDKRTMTRLITRPWEYIGLSRSAWYRLMSMDLAPKPLDLPEMVNRWRRDDIDRWLAGLKSKRVLKSRTKQPA
jgi:predicted DNA-binding transcriptional regulator AlpA